MHPKFQVPGNSILATSFFTIVISFINIGSTVAFDAIVSLGVVALMATYAVSIGCVLLKRLRGETLPPALWTLGKAGIYVNATALLYIT